MENLLNLCWVLLAMGALLTWRRQVTSAHASQGGRLIALLCVLALMFPVISATDDLHPVAQAIEDSSKRTQKSRATIKSVITHVASGCSPAVVVEPAVVTPSAGLRESLRPAAVPSLQTRSVLLARGRAPPLPAS